MFSPESEVNVQCEPMEENVLIYVIDKRKEMSLLQASLLLASLTLILLSAYAFPTSTYFIQCLSFLQSTSLRNGHHSH